MKNAYMSVSGIIFGVVAVLQAVRAFNQWTVASRAHICANLVFVGGCTGRWWLVRVGVYVTPQVVSFVRA